MRPRVNIENIEDMRRREGIEDVELAEAIRGLKVGACVNLTFLGETPGSAGEVLLVRITSIRGASFRGKLVKKPTSVGLAGLQVGLLLTFTRSHIHSLPEGCRSILGDIPRGGARDHSRSRSRGFGISPSTTRPTR